MFSRKVKSNQVYWKRKSWVRELFWKYDECAICKTKKELEPHHIIKTDKSKELYYDLNNGVLLCHRCHRLYHKLFSEINPSTLLEFSQEYSQKLKKWVK